VTDLDIGLEDGARGASRVCTAGARINPAPGTTECCAINGRRYRTRPACGLAYRAVALQRLAAYQEARIWPSSKWPSTAMTCRGN